MNREQVIATLRAHEPELQRAGVLSMSVFGSVAREEAGLASDVDVAVRLAESFSSASFDYFGRLDDLEQQLSQLLGCKVDVVAEPVRKRGFQHEIERDRAFAFWQKLAATCSTSSLHGRHGSSGFHGRPKNV